MKINKFLIMSESYDENIGGYVVLSKLCDELNKLGYIAKLVPARNFHSISTDYFFLPLFKLFKERCRRLKKYKTNPNFLTPVANKKDLLSLDESWVVVYPETISGNPLNAKNVVRWFLHHPGFHNQKCFYGFNELYFKFHSGIKVPQSLVCSTSTHELRIVHYPLELYNLNGVASERKGSAFTIRKGKGKPIVHNLKESICIDGKSHKEIASIFKRVENFYSYDPYTHYTTLAALCGCNAVVIPDHNIKIDDWIPDRNNRAGIAYGIESIDQANNEREILFKRVSSELENNRNNTIIFINEVNRFFQN